MEPFATAAVLDRADPARPTVSVPMRWLACSLLAGGPKDTSTGTRSPGHPRVCTA